ncbi:Nn.00g013550.m01.CDS01 [Neocucurbitaria sp. VM-36]
MRFIFSTLLAFATSVTATGSALVLNNSTNPIYLWSTGSEVGPRQKVVSGGLYMEDLHRDEKTGGIAIKITKNEDGLFNGDPQQVFAYTLDGAQVWYDLNAIFGEPFHGQRVEVTSNSGGAIVWTNGSNPGGSQVKVTSSDENIWFTIYGAPAV